MKHLKKLTLVTTAAFLFCLTAVSGTINSLPLPSITVETEDNAEPTPLPEKPEINPLADDEEEDCLRTK